MITRRLLRVLVCVAASAFLLTLAIPSGALAATKAEIKCSQLKQMEAGKYAQCRLKTAAIATKKGETPDYSKCESKLEKKFDRLDVSVCVSAEGAATAPAAHDVAALIGSMSAAISESVAIDPSDGTTTFQELSTTELCAGTNVRSLAGHCIANTQSDCLRTSVENGGVLYVKITPSDVEQILARIDDLELGLPASEIAEIVEELEALRDDLPAEGVNFWVLRTADRIALFGNGPWFGESRPLAFTGDIIDGAIVNVVALDYDENRRLSLDAWGFAPSDICDQSFGSEFWSELDAQKASLSKRGPAGDQCIGDVGGLACEDQLAAFADCCGDVGARKMSACSGTKLFTGVSQIVGGVSFFLAGFVPEPGLPVFWAAGGRLFISGINDLVTSSVDCKKEGEAAELECYNTGRPPGNPAPAIPMPGDCDGTNTTFP